MFGHHQDENPRPVSPIGTLVRKAGLSRSFGGIAFEMPASAQVIDSVHMLYDERSGFSSLMKMVDRNPAQTLRERTGSDGKPWTLWAPMLALSAPDPAFGFPAGTVLQPTIFVRNVTAKRQSASITLSWRGDSGKGKDKLPELSLAPFETRQIQVGTMQKQLGIPDSAHWTLVTVTTSAMPDELMAVASSYDATLRYGMQAPFYSGLGDHFVGGEWRVDTTHNELMAVTNVGTRATDALLTLYYNNGKDRYEMQRKIGPGDQVWLNFADLIHRCVADRKGRMLPADLTSGTYDLRDLNPGKGGQLIGSEFALDTTFGQQVQPDHLRCCGFENPSLYPGPVDIPPNQQGDIYVQAQDCNGVLQDISDDFTDWWSSDNSIAQVTYKQVYGVSPGDTTGYASGDVLIGNGSYCTVEPVQVWAPIFVGPVITSIDPDTATIGSGNNSITINGHGFGTSPTVNLPPGFSWEVQSSTDTKIHLTGVAIAYTATVGNNSITVTVSPYTSPHAYFQVDGPYHMIVENDVTDVCSGCSTTVRRRVTYQIQNFGGTNAGVLNLGENLSDTTWSCSQQQPAPDYSNCVSDPAVTNSNGQFTDTWTLSSDSYTPVGCGWNTTDHWQWCGHNPYQTLGTLTGYLHTDHIEINGVVSPSKIQNGTVIPF